MTSQVKNGGENPEGARVRQALLAHMRHELRTPLNAILGYSEMLLEDTGKAGSATFLADLKRVHQAGMNLISRINLILDPEKI